MHMQMFGRGCDRALVEDDLVWLDALHVPEPDDVLYATELLELTDAHRPALHHGRHDGSIGAEHHLVLFEAFEDLLHRRRCDHRLEVEHDARERPRLSWLKERPIEDP